MLVKMTRRNGSNIIKKELINVDKLKFISEDIKHINNYDMQLNFSVIIPCLNDYLVVETIGLKNDYKMGFNLIGKISLEDLNLHFDPFYDSQNVSVGELTRRENTIVKFNELLRLDISSYNLFNPVSNLESCNLSHLDAICKMAFNNYLCDRIFIDDPEYYKLGELDLY